MNDSIVQAISILGTIFATIILAPIFIFGGINWLETQQHKRAMEDRAKRKKKPEDFYHGPG